MGKARLEAFSDGVIAVVITIPDPSTGAEGVLWTGTLEAATPRCWS